MKSTPPNPQNSSFVEKLLMILQDPECQPYVQWLQRQNGFNIVDVSGFSQNVLPTYFKHQNFSSFVRQLNMYGFTKVRTKDGDNIYEHKYFKRGSKSSIKKIQRKISAQPFNKGNELVLYQPGIFCQRRKKQGQIQKLREKQIELQKKCNSLLQTNRQLLSQNQQIVKQIRSEQIKKKKLLEQIIAIITNKSTGEHMLSIESKPVVGDNKREGEMREHTNIEQPELIDLGITKQKEQVPLDILDPNQSYVKLDDFLNIDYDQLSEIFKM